MSPAPGANHQRVCLALGSEIRSLLRGRPCEVFIAPLDVKLSDADIVQPDVIVVCDPAKVTDTHVEGAPDVVVEIASPSTTVYDRIRKLRLYAEYGVKEYWLVTPYPHLVEVLLLDGDSYRIHSAFTKADTLTSPTLTDIEIALERIFDFPISDDERIDEVREGIPPYGHAPRAEQ